MHKRILLLACLISQHVFATHEQFSLNADLLYWTISEVGSDNWAQILNPQAINQSTQILGLNFNWRPGFRAGLNFLSENQLWDSKLNYTWYQTQASGTSSTTSQEIHSAFSGNFYAQNVLGNGVSGPYYHQAAINWTFLYNNIDWEIGRNFKFDDYQARPFLGIKAAFLNQTINTTWGQPYNNEDKTPITTFSIATENMKNNFWGVGPSLGLNTQWDLIKLNTQSFGLLGEFSAAFLWGGWQTSDVYQNNSPVSISTVNNLRTSGVWMSRGQLGINWKKDIQNINLVINLAYEAQMWMNQLKFYSFDGGRQNNTLYIQGGVLNACIHF
jgi:hypothetical protein